MAEKEWRLPRIKRISEKIIVLLLLHKAKYSILEICIKIVKFDLQVVLFDNMVDWPEQMGGTCRWCSL